MLAACAAVALPPAPLSAAAGSTDAPGAAREPTLGELMAGVRSWGYQLQDIDPGALAASSLDLLVIDYSSNGTASGRLSASTVRRLKRKPDGGRRLVLAYFSIGEAEEYRQYWRPEWLTTVDAEGSPAAAPPVTAAPSPAPAATAPPATAPPATAPPATTPPLSGSAGATAPGMAAGAPPPARAKPKRVLSDQAPAWLGEENESWSGNFSVLYWDEAWQALLIGRPGSYLDHIIDAGFDGVYLDRVDAFYEYDEERTDAADLMIAFVERIARAARARAPGFLIVPQNGEELLTRPAYVATIDAIAKEDLLYGSPVEAVENSPAQVANSVRWLTLAREAKRPVLVIEYVDAPADVAKARGELARLGYVATFGPRMLDKLAPEAAGGRSR